MSSGYFPVRILANAILALGLVLTSGCAPLGSILRPATATATLVPTASATPTSTPKPTRTPRPTNTPTPTPAPMGATVTYGSLEITVLAVANRESVHFGDVSKGWETFYKPNPGSFLIDVGVSVRNLNPDHEVRVKWGDIYIVDNDGAWYPIWGSTKTPAAGKKLDPFSIGLSSDQLDPTAEVEFDGETYLRLIYGTSDDPEQIILFAIEDSPQISFPISD